MVELEWTITQKPKVVGVRKLKEFCREGFRQAVLFWHRKYHPLHYRSFSAAKYRYKQRRKGYIERKKLGINPPVKRGGLADIVRSGLTESVMTRPRPVRAYPTRARMRMPGPSYVTMRPRDSRKPSLAREITRVISSEERAILKTFEITVMRQIKAVRQTKRTRIRG